jgi:hypothetical protein
MPFVGKSQSDYTIVLSNLDGQVPTISDIKNGKIKMEYALNNKPIQAEIAAYTIIHLPASGEVQAPFTSNLHSLRWISATGYLRNLKITSGDKIFIEDILLLHNGKNIKIKSLPALSF